MNASVDRLELDFRPAAVNATHDAFIEDDAIFAAFLPAILHCWLARILIQMDIEVALN